MSGSLPFVNKCRDEINARLVSHDKSLLKFPSHSETVCAELVKYGSCLFIESNVYLVKSLHVMNIHSHHVSQAMRHEHGVCSSSYSLFSVSFHESESFQSVSHEFAHSEMHIHVLDSGLCNTEHIVMAVLHNAVNLQLSLSEFAADRICSCVV